jgi:hypothetical protein
MYFVGAPKETKYRLYWLYWYRKGAKATEHEELSKVLMVEHGIDGRAVKNTVILLNKSFLKVNHRGTEIPDLRKKLHRDLFEDFVQGQKVDIQAGQRFLKRR